MDITLTKLTVDDVEGVHTLWSDKAATQYTNFSYLPTLQECRERLAKMMAFYGTRDDHFGPFVIRNQVGEFLGLTGGDAGATPGEFEIWYFVRRANWGKHVATSAVTRLLALMNESGRVSMIKAEAVVDNEPSWRFLTKLGFERTSLLPKKDEKSWNRYLYTKPV